MNNRFIIQLFIVAILGAIAVFSYSPYHIAPIAFVSFSGLLIFANQPNKKRAAIIGLVWGIGYFLAGVHWVYISIRQYGELPSSLAIFILSIFILYLSLYPMLFTLLLYYFKRKVPANTFKQLVLLSPLLWQITEYLRGHLLNGFSWLQFGYSQLDTPLRSLFPIVGINGVNLIFTIVCGLFVYLLTKIKYRFLIHSDLSKKSHIFGAIIALLFIILAPISLNNHHWTQKDDKRNIDITLVQGNIKQSIRWDQEQRNQALSTYLALTEKSLNNSDIIIWPETAITDLEINQIDFLQHINTLAYQHNAAIVTGIISDKVIDHNLAFYNTVIVLGDQQTYHYPEKNSYVKQHLVPFGEYTPLESILKPIASLLNIPMSSISSGSANQAPLSIKGFHFSTVICYEIILTDIVRQTFSNNTDFLLTVSNDAWFGDSIAPWQHLQMAQARAIEFGRPLIRATNNGITAFINPQGHITDKLPQFKIDTLKKRLYAYSKMTPYTKWGNTPFYLFIFIMFVLIFIKKRN